MYLSLSNFNTSLSFSSISVTASGLVMSFSESISIHFLDTYRSAQHIASPTENCKMHYDLIFLKGKHYKNNIDGSTS